ncbi:hypothetical protein BC332_21742 [Capsicum chinense]|nr:hypothetical protein BC332_21742 [Capsicum chinense]
MDHRYKRFRDGDLFLICYRYDALFSNIVVTGERARVANQEQIFGIEVDLDKEKTNNVDDFDKEHFINLNDEGSDDLHDMDSFMFLKPLLKRQLLTDDIGTSSRVKKSKTKSSREELHSIVEFNDGIGALDGKHVKARLLLGQEIPYIDRKEQTFDVWKARWSILRDMSYYNIDIQRDIVITTMAIQNYIRKKCNVDNAFQVAENKRYIPSVDFDVGTTSTANNIDGENVSEESNEHWVGLRDMIANDICNA